MIGYCTLAARAANDQVSETGKCQALFCECFAEGHACPRRFHPLSAQEGDLKNPDPRLFKRLDDRITEHPIKRRAGQALLKGLDCPRRFTGKRMRLSCVFAQPVIGPSGSPDAYSLAVTGTTSLAFADGLENNGDTRELYRSTRLLYVPINQLQPTVAEIVRQLAREQF